MVSRKLTEEQVIEIWHRGHNGEPVQSISEDFDVAYSPTYRIVAGEMYKDVTSKLESRERLYAGERTKIKIMFALSRYIEEHWKPPLLRELAELVGLSTSRVYRHIDEMVDAGILYRDPTAQHRSYRIHKPNGLSILERS